MADNPPNVNNNRPPDMVSNVAASQQTQTNGESMGASNNSSNAGGLASDRASTASTTTQTQLKATGASYAAAAVMPKELRNIPRQLSMLRLPKKPDPAKIRQYLLDELPLDGIRDFVKKKFPSTTSCVINKQLVSGRFRPSLTISFEDDDDYKNAEIFTVKNGKRSVTYRAVPPKYVKGMTPCDRILKNLTLKCAPWDLVNDETRLVKVLGKYADLDTGLMTAICRNDMFTGEVVIPVNEWKLIPPREIHVPDIDEKGEESEDCVSIIGLIATGFNPYKLNREPEIKPSCQFCKSKGRDSDHKHRDCPTRPPARKFRCNNCGSNDGKCSRRKCANIEATKNGQFAESSSRRKTRASSRGTRADMESSSRVNAGHQGLNPPAIVINDDVEEQRVEQVSILATPPPHEFPALVPNAPDRAIEKRSRVRSRDEYENDANGTGQWMTAKSPAEKRKERAEKAKNGESPSPKQESKSFKYSEETPAKPHQAASRFRYLNPMTSISSAVRFVSGSTPPTFTNPQ